MRPQKVSVNVWQMLLSSCSYLFLVFLGWVFVRLVQACFWFPSYMNKQQARTDSVDHTDTKSLVVEQKITKPKDEKKSD